MSRIRCSIGKLFVEESSLRMMLLRSGGPHQAWRHSLVRNGGLLLPHNRSPAEPHFPFFLSADFILRNFHVIQNRLNIRPRSVSFEKPAVMLLGRTVIAGRMERSQLTSLHNVWKPCLALSNYPSPHMEVHRSRCVESKYCI